MKVRSGTDKVHLNSQILARKATCPQCSSLGKNLLTNFTPGLRHTDPTTAAKLSISLDAPLRDFLAQYQEAHGLKTRSEVVAQALTLLRDWELETQYAAALQEWTDSGDAAAWDSVSGDAL